MARASDALRLALPSPGHAPTCSSQFAMFVRRMSSKRHVPSGWRQVAVMREVGREQAAHAAKANIARARRLPEGSERQKCRREARAQLAAPAALVRRVALG